MNTSNAKMVALSNRIYEEWHAKTVLVQSCDRSYEGELNLETRELDIKVFHDLSIHKTTIKERQLKPADPELIKSSTKRVTIDKGRYSHWMETNIDKLVDDLSQENSVTRQKLVNKWAREAEKELAIWVAQLKAKQEIDLTNTAVLEGGIIKPENVLNVLDILIAHVDDVDMDVSDFQFFSSSRFYNILRDAKVFLAHNLDANETFKSGYVGTVSDIDFRQLNVKEITTRNKDSKQVEAEWGIWKTRDGIQYVVPFRTTDSYTIEKSQILLGGTGYQQVEFYDFFNLYEGRLMKVKMSYVTGKTPPTTFPETNV